MPRETITPEYINQPNPGRKEGTIKDTEGNFWFAKPEVLALCEKGKLVTFEYYSNDYNGKTYKHIKKVITENPNASAPMTQIARENVVSDSGEVAAAIRELNEIMRGIGTVLKRDFPAQPNADGAPF